MSESLKFRSPVRKASNFDSVEARRISLNTEFGAGTATYKATYSNTSDVDLRVITRQGIEILVESYNINNEKNRLANNESGLYVTYSIQTSSLDKHRVSVPMAMDANEKMCQNTEFINKHISDAMLRNATTTNPMYVEVNIEYFIPIETISENDGSVYIPTLDIVVKLATVKTVLHPYSEMGRLAGFVQQTQDNLGATVGHGFKLIDNSNTIGKLYYRSQGRVYCLIPTQDPELKDGVYRSNSGSVSSEMQISRVSRNNQVDYYQPDSSEIRDVLGMYPTYREALNCQTEKERMDEERQRAEDARKQAEAIRAHEMNTELHQLKLQHLKDGAAVNKEALQDKERRDTEDHVRQVEINEQKQSHEQSMQQSRSSLEWLKFASQFAAVVVGVISIVFGYLQARAKASHLYPGLLSCL